jgi:dihydroorotate dehydrogenase (fumarate)
MANLETTYLGLKLKNPLVAASSGITNSAEKIKKLEQAGIGAVVLKSVFEEQIKQRNNQHAASGFPKHRDILKLKIISGIICATIHYQSTSN